MSESGTAGSRRAETPGRDREGLDARRVRSLLASAIWLLAVVAALVLAVGTLLVALRVDLDDPVVRAITDLAARLDLGELVHVGVERGADAGARQDAVVTSVLVSWGVAALVYLVAGTVLDRVIRPGA